MTSVPGPSFEVGHDEPSHISTGGANSEARRRRTSRMFSPEWFGPVKKRAMGLPWGLAETTPVVNTPVRVSPSGRVTSNTFMPVSSP